jgi:hypothetical protein
MTKFLPLAALLTTACYEKAPPAGVGLRGDVSLPGLNTKDDDGDQFSEADGDCDDTDPTVYPGAAELCDKIDNDCDGEVDTNIDADIGTRVYPDGDGDGFGLEDDAFYACDYVLANPAEAGIATNGLDCDDSDRFINPAASELCDDIDNDCDGSVDDDPINGEPMYTDGDNDGFGDGEVQGTFCEEEGPPDGYAATSTDCNDTDDQVYPGNIEVCDGIDNDCDGDADSNAVDQVIFYPDTDADGFGDAAGPTVGPACSVPGMWVDNADDCDDGSADINPDAEEVCDTIDNDCNGAIDEALTTTYYADADGDGHGDPEAPTAQCADPGTGFAISPDDCDDTDATISPSATEGVGDDIDADCDGSELCFADEDSDGYTADSPAVVTSVDAFCSGPGEALATAPAGDCDDTDAALGSVTMDGDCDGILTAEDCDDADEFAVAIADDGDCDGILTAEDCDDADAFAVAIADDGDCDGILTAEDCDDEDEESTVVADDADCDGFVTTEDCDDEDEEVNPDAEEELDDGVDNNCDGGDWVTCIGDFLLIGPAPSTNIAELEFCGAVTGSIEISGSELLTDTSGLARLGTVGGDLILEDNLTMSSIDLPLLTSVDGDLSIGGNDMLTAVSVPLLESATEVDISDNTALCQSDVDDIEAALIALGWGGLFVSAGNLDGC